MQPYEGGIERWSANPVLEPKLLPLVSESQYLCQVKTVTSTFPQSKGMMPIGLYHWMTLLNVKEGFKYKMRHLRRRLLYKMILHCWKGYIVHLKKDWQRLVEPKPLAMINPPSWRNRKNRNGWNCGKGWVTGITKPDVHGWREWELLGLEYTNRPWVTRCVRVFFPTP